MYLAEMLLPHRQSVSAIFVLHIPYRIWSNPPCQCRSQWGLEIHTSVVCFSCTPFCTSLRHIKRRASALSLPLAITLEPQGFLYDIIRNMLISALWEIAQNGKKNKNKKEHIPIAPHESCPQVQPQSISSTYHGRYGGVH